jgi:hypothetical protein
VNGAVSDIKINSLFEKRTVEMVISLKPPADRTNKGQIGWVKRQFSACAKKDEALFNSLVKEIYLEIFIKNSSVSERFPIDDFDKIVDGSKDKEIREFKVIYLKDFGKKFSSPKKFVEMIEEMLTDYYKIVVQHMSKWEPQAPKMNGKQEALDNEDFIESVNSKEFISDKLVMKDESAHLNSAQDSLLTTNEAAVDDKDNGGF